MEVKYRDIPGMDGYIAGSDGTIWSQFKNCGRNGYLRFHDYRRQLKGKPDKRGYIWVRPRINGVYFDRKVGRLVMEAFVGPMPTGQLVRHLNDDKADNRLENLAYGTHSENAEDARANGKLCEGEKHGNAKYTAEQIGMVRKLRLGGLTYSAIAKATGVKRPSVIQISTGRQWSSVKGEVE